MSSCLLSWKDFLTKASPSGEGEDDDLDLDIRLDRAFPLPGGEKPNPG